MIFCCLIYCFKKSSPKQKVLCNNFKKVRRSPGLIFEVHKEGLSPSWWLRPFPALSIEAASEDERPPVVNYFAVYPVHSVEPPKLFRSGSKRVSLFSEYVILIWRWKLNILLKTSFDMEGRKFEKFWIDSGFVVFILFS